MIETYQTIPIKYRPMKIGDLIGQETAKRILTNMFKNKKLSRTIFAAGSWGCGKTTVARLIARYLNCQDPVDYEPCGVCFSCKEMSRVPPNHPDLVEINAADTRGIDTIREIRDAAQFSPRTNYRVFILDECHSMTPQALQALLKVLEEPPSKSVFILCTTEPGSVPSTIKSRALKITLDPVKDDVLSKYLAKIAKKENLPLSTEILEKIASNSRGHVRDALSMLENLSHIIQSGETVKIDDVVDTIIEEFLAVEPETIAAQILLSIYKGKFTPAAKIIKHVDNYVTVFEKMLTLHTLMMSHTLSEKLDDSIYCDFYEKLDSLVDAKTGVRDLYKSGSLGLDKLSLIMEALVDNTTRAKTYSVNGHYLLHNFLVKTLTATKEPTNGQRNGVSEATSKDPGAGNLVSPSG